jgi:ATP-binding protein involved in chromosome partitioning
LIDIQTALEKYAFQRREGMNDVVSPNEVLEALRTVQEPELNNDLVSLGMIKDLKVEGGSIEFTIELTTPACPLRDQIKAEAKRAVENIAGVSEVKVNMTANVPTDSRTHKMSHNAIRNVVAIASARKGEVDRPCRSL